MRQLFCVLSAHAHIFICSIQTTIYSMKDKTYYIAYGWNIVVFLFVFASAYAYVILNAYLDDAFVNEFVLAHSLPIFCIYVKKIRECEHSHSYKG